MKIDKLLKLARTLRPTAFDDEILMMWVNEIEGMVLNEIHLVAVADLTPYELGENGEVPTAELTAPYPYDKLYTQYLLAQIDYANGEYSKYQNTMEMFNACYADYVHYAAEVLAPADGRATLLQYYLSAYAIARNHGYTGTEEQWLKSLHGDSGKSVVMRYQDKIIQWAQEGAAAWENLVDMQDIQDAITQDAQDTIQDATATATAAKTAAEAAKSAAQTAQAGAETAKAAAQSSAGDALQSARDAIQAADDAEIAAAGAAGDAAAAEAAKATAQTAATEAAAQKAAASSAAGDAEAWSQGTRGGAAVGTADETYHNNAKYWAQQAAASGGGEVTKDAVIGALGYTPADESDIPTTLPNPESLIITVGGTETQYDGLDEKEVELGALAGKSAVGLGGADVTGTLPLSNGGTGAETAEGALENLGGLPKSGGTMVNSGDKKGCIEFPGINSAYREGRDNAAVKVQYPADGSGDNYVPIFSGKGKTCSWDAAIYGDAVNLVQIGDTEYAAGTNAPKTRYIIGADGITGIQGWYLVANGSLSQGATLSGSADNSKYKTVHVLFGSTISGSNYYQSYDFPLPAEADFWNIYIPAQNDYFRARIDITAAGGITVTMQSDASRQCFIYVSV